MSDEPGPTGDFPQGKLNEDDEGGLNCVVAREKGCVRIDFGRPVAWLAMPPDLAIAFGETVIAHARALEKDA